MAQVDFARLRGIVRTIERGGVWRGCMHNVRKDGSRFWCAATIHGFRDDPIADYWVAVLTEENRGSLPTEPE